ncbi:MAG: glycosyltransferase family 2 protein [Ignavibacterium sp.]
MMNDLKSIAGVVVLYNPQNDLLENIKSYINQLDQLFIINNSTTAIEPDFTQLLPSNKISIINNKENMGIAAALNQGIRLALSSGSKYLLTMDQDSRISSNFVQDAICKFENQNDVGIVCPTIIHNANQAKKHFLAENKIAITSGSLLNLSVTNSVGRFDENLFIDYVDYEYSLRLLSRHFKIIHLENAFLYHNLGNMKKVKFLWMTFFPTNHSPERLFYRTRNRFYVYKLYSENFKDFIFKDKLHFLKEILKILLLEKNRLQKLIMIQKGYKSYKRKTFGRYSEKNYIERT